MNESVILTISHGDNGDSSIKIGLHPALEKIVANSGKEPIADCKSGLIKETITEEEFEALVEYRQACRDFSAASDVHALASAAAAKAEADANKAQQLCANRRDRFRALCEGREMPPRYIP